MSNWKIDTNTKANLKPIINGIYSLFFENKENIAALPAFEEVEDFGTVDFKATETARKLTLQYQGKTYVFLIHLYNRVNGNCLAVYNEATGKNLIQLVLDKFVEPLRFGSRLWHDGTVTGVENLTKSKVIKYVKNKVPSLVVNFPDYGDYIEFGILKENEISVLNHKKTLQWISNLLVYAILRQEIKEEYNAGNIEDLPEEDERKYLLVNITWNSKNWQGPSEDASGHKFVVEGNTGHESWNFDFKNPRNPKESIYGFGQFTNPPSVSGSNNLIVFYSQNQIVGFYGKAEVLDETVKVNKRESYNLIGSRPLSLVLKNKIEEVKEKSYLEDKKRVGQVGFNYLNNLANVNNILQEALKLNPDQSSTLNALIDWVNTDYTKFDKNEIIMEANNSHPLNQILFGPPGTGKTYHTISEAIKVVDPDFYNANASNRDKLQNRFNELLIRDWKSNMGQIAFCTFHQSFSYEDFVEGIKPKLTEEKSVYYDIEDGIFKSICRQADAIKNAQTLAKENLVNFTESQFNQAVFYKVSLGDTSKQEGKDVYDYCINNNVMSIGFGDGVDFTGKDEEKVNGLVKEYTIDSYAAQAINYFKNYLQVGNYIVVSNGNLYIRALGKVTGEYRYEEDSDIGWNHFRNVEWIFKDVEIPVNEFYQKNLSQQTIYKLKKEFIIPSFFIKTNNKAEQKNETKNFVIIIDEINRGNVSSIFGELITLIEPTKRYGNPEALEVMLPYSKKRFTVPANVYIIGTMNTADRSIESLDTALRRRFSFIEMSPKSSLIKSEGKSKGVVEGVDLLQLLDRMNERIEKLIDKDHKIGHSYFMTVNSIESLQLAFKDKVIPLLEEYFFGDFGKIGLVLGSSFVKKEINDFDFAKFEDYDPQSEQDLKQRAIYTIRPMSDWAFKSIYE